MSKKREEMKSLLHLVEKRKKSEKLFGLLVRKVFRKKIKEIIIMLARTRHVKESFNKKKFKEL